MKKIIYLLMFLFVGILISGCNQTILDSEVTISLDNYTLALEVGESKVVYPTVTGLEGLPNLIYTSSNEEVFIIEGEMITGLAAGVEMLTISVQGTNAKTNISVTVIDSNDDGEEVLELSIIASKTKINVNENMKLNVLANSTIYMGEIQWFSNNTTVATIDSTGLITAIKAGKTTITALVGDVWNTINITVQEAAGVDEVVVPTIKSITLTGTNFINVNGALEINVDTDTNEVPNLIWSSSNEAIASVNDAGVVIGIGSGVATITAALANDSAIKGTFTILVKDAPEENDNSISSILITAPKEVLSENKIKLNITWVPASEYASFVYSSSNESVATVDSAGWVTGVSGGTVQITVSLVADNSKSATHTINVIPLPEGLTVTGSNSLSYGQNVSLQVQAYPVGSSAAVTWASSNTSVASVDLNGRVTAIAAGSTTITATSIVSGTITASHQITVTDARSIILSSTNLSLVAGFTQTITAVVNANSLSDKSIIWTSSNTAIATVSTNGLVTAKAAGSATIVAKLNADNSVQAQTAVTVTMITKPTITVTPTTASLLVGASQTLTAKVVNASNTAVTWASNNTGVATVANGVVTAKAAGSATITATASADTSVKATCIITVTAPVSGGALTVTADPGASIKVGATGYQLFIKDSSGASLSRTECTFTSSASSVATVSSFGTISALAVGSAKITVNHAKGTGTITLTITGTTVTPPASSLSITANPGASIKVGASGYQLYVTNSAGVSVSRTECKFTTSASSIATVSVYGTISALKAGSAKITVTHPSFGTGTITLTVTGTTVVPPPTGVTENKRNTIIAKALSQKGYKEGSNNNTKYGAWYGLNYQPWCAMFVSWCANQSGVPTSIILKYAGVYAGNEWFKAKGSARYKTFAQTKSGAYTPICGDIVFFKSNGASHTGLVIKCVGNTMYTIEGNTSDMVKIKYHYYKTNTQITGYGVPAYPASSTAITNFSVSGASYGGGTSTT